MSGKNIFLIASLLAAPAAVAGPIPPDAPPDPTAQAWLGIHFRDDGYYDYTNHVWVDRPPTAWKLDADSPADRAGLWQDDVMVKFNGKKVSVSEFDEHLRYYRPGAKVSLVVRRGGKELTFNITLGEKTR